MSEFSAKCGQWTSIGIFVNGGPPNFDCKRSALNIAVAIQASSSSSLFHQTHSVYLKSLDESSISAKCQKPPPSSKRTMPCEPTRLLLNRQPPHTATQPFFGLILLLLLPSIGSSLASLAMNFGRKGQTVAPSQTAAKSHHITSKYNDAHTCVLDCVVFFFLGSRKQQYQPSSWWNII